jgi:hypothetical protein
MAPMSGASHLIGIITLSRVGLRILTANQAFFIAELDLRKRSGLQAKILLNQFSQSFGSCWNTGVICGE